MQTSPSSLREKIQPKRWHSGKRAFLAIMIIFAVIHLPSMETPFSPLDDYWQLDHVKSFQDWPDAFGADVFGFWRPVKNFLFLGYSALSSFGMLWARLPALGIGLLAIHAVYRFAEELTASTRHAALCTALWAFSPTLVSSTAWLSCTNILLMTALACHALRLHLASFADGADGPAQTRRRLGAAALMLAALLAYEGGIVIPALAILLDFFRHPKRLWSRSNIGVYLLYLLPMLIYLSLRFTLGSPQSLEAHFRNTTAAQASLSSAWFTLGHLSWWLVPFGRFALLGEYEYGMVTLPWLTAAWLFLVTACALAFAFRKSHPLASIGWCWYLLAFSPMSNLAGLLTGPWGDYYLTLPSLGLALLASTWIQTGLARKSTLPRLLSMGFLATRLAAIHTASLWSGYWNHPQTLWEKTHLTFPDSARPLIYLSKIQIENAQLDEAAQSLDNATRIHPESPHLLPPKTILAIRRGQFAEAETHALRYARTNRDTWALGILGYFQEEIHGNPGQAKLLYEEAVQKTPWSHESSFAAKRLALIHAQNHQLDSAISLWQNVLRHNPADVEGRTNLSIALRAQQQQNTAVSNTAAPDAPPTPAP